jgi:predicted RNase H-like HicB family nuclease
MMPSHTKRNRSTRQSGIPKATNYDVLVYWSEEDGCHLAEVPALQGCVTHGDSAEAALHEVLSAAQLWLDDAVRHKERVPLPQPRRSGKLTLRLPISLHQNIARAAEVDGVSLNQWVVAKLAGQVP